MTGFTKLSKSIVLSSVWAEPDAVRLTWITMLALADPEGYVGASVPGLASAARVPLDACEKALESFLAPDPYSRSKEHEGRRIEVAEGGWRILNYRAYWEGRDPEERRRQNREAKRRQRERASAKMLTDADNADSQQVSAQGEGEREGERDQKNPPSVGRRSRASTPKSAKGSKRVPETWEPNEEHRQIAREEGRDFERELKKFRDHTYKKALTDWDAAFRNWLRSEYGRPYGSSRSDGPKQPNAGFYKPPMEGETETKPEEDPIPW